MYSFIQKIYELYNVNRKDLANVFDDKYTLYLIQFPAGFMNHITAWLRVSNELLDGVKMV